MQPYEQRFKSDEIDGLRSESPLGSDSPLAPRGRPSATASLPARLRPSRRRGSSSKKKKKDNHRGLYVFHDSGQEGFSADASVEDIHALIERTLPGFPMFPIDVHQKPYLEHLMTSLSSCAVPPQVFLNGVHQSLRELGSLSGPQLKQKLVRAREEGPDDSPANDCRHLYEIFRQTQHEVFQMLPARPEPRTRYVTYYNGARKAVAARRGGKTYRHTGRVFYLPGEMSCRLINRTDSWCVFRFLGTPELNAMFSYKPSVGLVRPRAEACVQFSRRPDLRPELDVEKKKRKGGSVKYYPIMFGDADADADVRSDRDPTTKIPVAASGVSKDTPILCLRNAKLQFKCFAADFDEDERERLTSVSAQKALFDRRGPRVYEEKILVCPYLPCASDRTVTVVRYCPIDGPRTVHIRIDPVDAMQPFVDSGSGVGSSSGSSDGSGSGDVDDGDGLDSSFDELPMMLQSTHSEFLHSMRGKPAQTYFEDPGGDPFDPQATSLADVLGTSSLQPLELQAADGAMFFDEAMVGGGDVGSDKEKDSSSDSSSNDDVVLTLESNYDGPRLQRLSFAPPFLTVPRSPSGSRGSRSRSRKTLSSPTSASEHDDCLPLPQQSYISPDDIFSPTKTPLLPFDFDFHSDLLAGGGENDMPFAIPSRAPDDAPSGDDADADAGEKERTALKMFLDMGDTIPLASFCDVDARTKTVKLSKVLEKLTQLEASKTDVMKL